MDEEYRNEILKQKLLYDMYRKERVKQGDIEIPSNEKDKEKLLISKLEKKPERLEGEADEDYQTRLNQWEARVGVKLKEDGSNQRDKLLKNFQKIMSPSEAAEMMSYPLITEDNIKKLNQHWKAFEEALRKKYSSLDFDLLEEFIYKYIETINNGETSNDELKRQFVMLNDKLDNMMENESISDEMKRQFTILNDRIDLMSDNNDELKTLIDNSSGKTRMLLFSLSKDITDLVNEKNNLTLQELTQKTEFITEAINRTRIAMNANSGTVNTQMGNVLTRLNDVVRDLSQTEQRIIGETQQTEQRILGATQQTEANIQNRINELENRLEAKVKTLFRSTSKGIKKILSKVNKSNNVNIRKVQTRLEGLSVAIQQQNINLINQRATEILQQINTSRALNLELNNETQELITDIIEATNDIIEATSDIIQETTDIKEQINELSTNVNESRDVLRYDLDSAISRMVNNQSRMLDGIMNRNNEPVRDEPLFETQFLSRSEANRQLEEQMLEPDEATSSTAVDPRFYNNNEVIQQFRDNPRNYDNVRGKLDTINNRRVIYNLAKEYVNSLSSTSGAVFIRGFEKNILNIENAFNISNQNIDNYIIPLITYERNRLLSQNPKIKARVNNRNNNLSVIDARKIFGAGLQKNNITFGRYEIDSDKLDHQNLLVVFHNTSMNRVKYFPQKKVSNEMKDLINYVCSKNKYNEKLFNLLEDDEKLLFKSMFNKSGLSKMLNVKVFDDETKQAKKDYDNLKEKYYIIEGEIGAGNDNPELTKEFNNITKQLKKQIVYMNKVGLLGLKESNNLILSL